MAGDITEFTLRIPSVIATSTALLLTYFIVLPYAGRRRALMTAVLLGNSPAVSLIGRRRVYLFEKPAVPGGEQNARAVAAIRHPGMPEPGTPVPTAN